MKRHLLITFTALAILAAAYFLPWDELLTEEVYPDFLGDVFAEPAWKNNSSDEVTKDFDGMERPYSGSLPWEMDLKFQGTLKKIDSPPLIAAYKATLIDPLPGEGYNVGLAASKLAGTIVAPGQVFSQNKALGPYTTKKGYKPGPTYRGSRLITTIGGGVCKIASVLYNVTTFADLEIVKRYPHSMTVPYVPPGQDATVFYGVKDFQFKNNTDRPILIWAQKVDNTLYLAIYGFKKPPVVTWHHQVLKRFRSWTEYKKNPKIRPGEENLLVPGQEGLVVRSWVTVETPEGQTIIKKKGVSFYSPSPTIIERSSK
jgi:hypothetical protein